MPVCFWRLRSPRFGMRWDDEPRDLLRDLQDFARLTMWKWDVPPALLVDVDEEIIAAERKEQLQRYLADLDAPPRNTFEELRLVVQPRTIRIPLDQFGCGQGLELAGLARGIG